MNDKKTEALKLALEALEECRRDPRLKYEHPYYDKAITAIKEALAQPEQEPVAWITQNGKGWLRWHKPEDNNTDSVPLYTSPPASKPWVGLTEDEINEVLGGDIRDEPSGELEFVRAIEAKLKEKNA